MEFLVPGFSPTLPWLSQTFENLNNSWVYLPTSKINMKINKFKTSNKIGMRMGSPSSAFPVAISRCDSDTFTRWWGIVICFLHPKVQLVSSGPVPDPRKPHWPPPHAPFSLTSPKVWPPLGWHPSMGPHLLEYFLIRSC